MHKCLNFFLHAKSRCPLFFLFNKKYSQENVIVDEIKLDEIRFVLNNTCYMHTQCMCIYRSN